MLDLRSIIDQIKGYDTYSVRNGVIIRRYALFREEQLPVEEVESWAIYPEMIFDVVEIKKKNSLSLIWFDYRNDLIGILKSLA